MKIKYLATVCMALFLSIGMFSTTAFAYTDASAEPHRSRQKNRQPRKKVSRWNLLRLTEI